MKKHSVSRIAGIIMMGALAFAATAQAKVIEVDRAIPGRYIVVLKADALQPQGMLGQHGPTVPDLARKLAARYHGRPARSYTHAIQGFAVTMSASSAERMADDPHVAYVIQDGVTSAAAVESPAPSWGLDRIDQTTNDLDGKYTYNQTGAGVNIYIIDSGVRSTHVDLAGRVDTVHAFTTIHDGLGTEDGYGHGTAVAAVAAGTLYGVAKDATIHPVRVLGRNGRGTVSDLIAGIDWVAGNFQAPAVANISITAAPNRALDDAVEGLIRAGVFTTVAAGNGASDACLISPARVPDAFTVGASTIDDQRAYFSDVGTCVDAFAPGQNIKTAWGRTDTQTAVMSGTSFAAPAVAGTAAMELNEFPHASVQKLTWDILNSASQVIPEDANGSPTGLLYTGYIQAVVDQPPHATFTYTCDGRTCTVDARGSTDDHGIVSYEWDFDDGTIISGRKDIVIDHTFPLDGSQFKVMLTVTDTSGQSRSARRMIVFVPSLTR